MRNLRGEEPEWNVTEPEIERGPTTQNALNAAVGGGKPRCDGGKATQVAVVAANRAKVRTMMTPRPFSVASGYRTPEIWPPQEPACKP